MTRALRIAATFTAACLASALVLAAYPIVYALSKRG
jgi:hypothetical protein